MRFLAVFLAITIAASAQIQFGCKGVSGRSRPFIL
jgi:hypothetical protein